MHSSPKRSLTRYLTLFLLPAVLFLTGFGYGTPDNSLKKDSSLQTDSSYEKQIYERFLNNEITVMRNDQPNYIYGEEKPFYIRELFWDNDIEYCYFDIDGDGREELHIRDSCVYYAVKVKDQTLRILHEGWWAYEPVKTKTLCGVLYHVTDYHHESAAFITIDADGNKESTYSYSWYDTNKNGFIDETDAFNGPGGIDRTEFLRFQEEYATTAQTCQLPWQNRRIQNFASWQDAYTDFIHTLHATGWLPYPKDSRYSLVYLDGDAIPELYIETGGVTIHEIIVTYYNGKVQSINRGRAGMKYLERQGLLYDDSGYITYDLDVNRGSYPCNVYRLSKGTFTEIGTGWYTYQTDKEDNLLQEEYFWEGRAVTKAVYEMRLRELIDTSRCVEPTPLYKEKKILKILTQLP